MTKTLAATMLLHAIRQRTWFDAFAIGEAYEKRPVDFLREESTRRYMREVAARLHITEGAMVMTARGGSERDRMSRMAPCMGLLYAKWLDDALYKWLRSRIIR